MEWERRFLLERFPTGASVIRTRGIRDRYIEGTSLRLREQTEDNGSIVFKLTQKIRVRTRGAQQGTITTMCLSADEFRVFAQMPAATLSKTRYSIPPFGIDVFAGGLEGLVLAEAEFNSAAEAQAPLPLPSFILAEVTEDDRFTGGRLVRASREELKSWLMKFRIALK